MKSKLKPFDYTLFTVVIILYGLGLLMVLSASSHLGVLKYGSPYYFFIRQFLFGVIGICVMLFLSRINYKVYKNFSGLIFLGAIGLLCLVLVPGIGSGEIRGAKRWIYVGFNLQPSEVVKLAIIIFLSARISMNPEGIKKFWTGLVPYFLIIGVVAGLLYLEPHYSAIGIIGLISVIILFAGGAKVSHFVGIGLALAPVGIAGIIIAKYRLDRIVSFLDPWSDLQDGGWQVIQSLYALGSGGLFGLGLGQSRQKYTYLPDAHNDFVLAIWGEELGFIGMVFVIILFGILIWRGVVIATKAPDMFSGLVAIGITMLIAIQIILNVLIITSWFPVTGMPVPFMSYGGTSLLIFMSCIGILLNISRYGKNE